MIRKSAQDVRQGFIFPKMNMLKVLFISTALAVVAMIMAIRITFL